MGIRLVTFRFFSYQPLRLLIIIVGFCLILVPFKLSFGRGIICGQMHICESCNQMHEPGGVLATRHSHARSPICCCLQFMNGLTQIMIFQVEDEMRMNIFTGISCGNLKGLSAVSCTTSHAARGTLVQH